MWGKRIQIALKAGHYQPAHRQANDGLNTECWLGSFVIFLGSGLVLWRNPIFLWFFRGGVKTPCPPLWIRSWMLHHRTFSVCQYDVDLPFFLPFRTNVICYLFCLCTFVTLIANNMNPNQTAPLGSLIWVHNYCLLPWWKHLHVNWKSDYDDLIPGWKYFQVLSSAVAYMQ